MKSFANTILPIGIFQVIYGGISLASDTTLSAGVFVISGMLVIFTVLTLKLLSKDAKRGKQE